MAVLLDGKQYAEELRDELRTRVARFTAHQGRPPGLDVVLVGEDPASRVYTRSKETASRAIGMRSRLHPKPASCSEAELLELITALNADPAVDGILVQLPLPTQISSQKILQAIDPLKDVDGFHPVNAGLLASGAPSLVPCTPLGCMHLLRKAGVPLAGARALVLGRSAIVGRPVAQLLVHADATVTIAHSHTRDLPALCAEAEILIAAVGRPEFVQGGWIRPGAVVIDVGIHRGMDNTGHTTLVGDVQYASAALRAGWISPVPGGVGPLTIAYLLHNTLQAAERRRHDTREESMPSCSL